MPLLAEQLQTDLDKLVAEAYALAVTEIETPTTNSMLLAKPTIKK